MRASRLSRSTILALCLVLVTAAPSQAAVPTLPGAPDCPIFPESNVWNQRVDDLPVRDDSQTLKTSIGLDDYLHPDFGSYEGYGIPYQVVGERAPQRHVTFRYADESDPGPYPIPREPRIEGGSDRHLLIVDKSRCRLYELYRARLTENDGVPAQGPSGYAIERSAAQRDGLRGGRHEVVAQRSALSAKATASRPADAFGATPRAIRAVSGDLHDRQPWAT